MTMKHYNKTVFIGEEGAGKTSLINRLQYGIFDSYTSTTIGASYLKQAVTIDGKDVNLHLWDAAGQIRFNALLPMLIRGAKIVLICFERPNVKLVQKHIDEVERIDPSVRIILVMTKIDQINFRDVERMEEYASNIGLTIFSTSALTGQGIQSLFEEVARYFLSIDTDRKSSDEILDTVELRTDTPNPRVFTQCCIML